MGFPVWSAGDLGRGHGQGDLGDVNVPIVVRAASSSSPATWSSPTTTASWSCPVARGRRGRGGRTAREEKEAVSRARYLAGELSLDVNNMRADAGAQGASATSTTRRTWKEQQQ